MKNLLLFLLLTLLFSCADNGDASSEIGVTKIVHNAVIWTGEDIGEQYTAMAVEGERIKALGTDEEILKLANENTEIIDVKGDFVMAGLIEGHGHFGGLGSSLTGLNLLHAKSWDEVIEKVKEEVAKTPKGDWIVGRGWHQEKWSSSPIPNRDGYPYHDELSKISPDNPVYLGHASGHGSFANAKAMELAGVNKETVDPAGGRLVRDEEGNPIGVFEENAMGLVGRPYYEYVSGLSEEKKKQEWLNETELAVQECLKYGITTFQDAGTSESRLKAYKELAENGEIDIRLWMMVRHSFPKIKEHLSDFPIINAANNHFTVRAIKSEVDGALGSYGAWLIDDYSDKSGFHGQNTTPVEDVANIATLAAEKNMQLCVHAIGDRANREVLDIFEKYLSKEKDMRWRVEHAQHLSVEDIARFSTMGAIPSMQGVHCTSDALFVEKRLGEKRAREGAYAWRSLLNSGVIVANGTDVPIEEIDPFVSIYASVTRKRVDNGFEFFTEQSMTREEALKSYTIWNAYAAFEEEMKGSLKPGKLADFVIMDTNLLTCAPEAILETKVLKTFVGGELKYEK